jgi:hypothetical protein
MQTLLRSSLVLFLLPPIAAQSVVSPREYTSAEAPANNSYPFGVSTQVIRYVGIHDDLQGTPLLIKGMSMRRNGTSTTPIYPAYTITLDAWCSLAATTSTTPNTTFDNNHGSNKMQVVTNKTFNFPQADYGFVPSPFLHSVVFDTPYPYLASAPLCWEVQRTAITLAASIFHDGATNSANTNPPMAFTPFGTGCKVSSQNVAMTATGSAVMSWPSGTGTLTVSGQSGPANSVVLVIMGTSSERFSGIPLPFLIPGSGGAPSGPCNLYTNIVLGFAATTTSAGTSLTNIPVPATPDLNGLRTFEQIVALDPAANPLGVALSNGVNHNWIAPYQLPLVARVYLLGSLAPVASGVTANYGLVIRFDL